MVKSSSQPRKVIQVETSYGIVNKVPVMDWKEFISFWPNICRAIFEVLLENDFQPYTATLRRPKGFVAYGGYWKMSNKNPESAFIRRSIFHLQTAGETLLHEFYKTI